MATKICSDRIDAQAKQRIVSLIDSFGSKQNVQIPLLGDVDDAVLIANEIAAMNAREAAFVAKLQQRGMSNEQIDALRKDPNDCGCTGGAS